MPELMALVRDNHDARTLARSMQTLQQPRMVSGQALVQQRGQRIGLRHTLPGTQSAHSPRRVQERRSSSIPIDLR